MIAHPVSWDAMYADPGFRGEFDLRSVVDGGWVCIDSIEAEFGSPQSALHYNMLHPRTPGRSMGLNSCRALLGRFKISKTCWLCMRSILGARYTAGRLEVTRGILGTCRHIYSNYSVQLVTKQTQS